MDYPKAEYKVKFSYKGQEVSYNTIVALDTKKNTEEKAFHNAVFQMMKQLGFSIGLIEFIKKEIKESSPIIIKMVTTEI